VNIHDSYTNLGEPRLAEHMASFEDFFSEARQKTLLARFRTYLRGYKAVDVHGHVDHGHVDRGLAANVQNDMRQDR
jgi:hypothetical protein